MPLLMMCGYPCSGKTTRAVELQTYLSDKHNLEAVVIHDSEFFTDKNDVYSDSAKEKELRSALLSAVQRLLAPNVTVIVDAPNYIKGYRYQLYCVAKAAETTHAVVHCDADESLVREWNSIRPEPQHDVHNAVRVEKSLTCQRYRDDVLDSLFARFEQPNASARWDRPLFSVVQGAHQSPSGDPASDPLPGDEIHAALYLSRPPKANLSTVAQPVSSSDLLHELDRRTRAVIDSLLDSQRHASPGDQLAVPGTERRVQYRRPFTLPELHRIKRSFLNYLTGGASSSSPSGAGGTKPESVPGLFVDFVNANCTA